MREFIYTIKDELGIHARPAGSLVKTASAFSSAITLESGGKKGDAKKIMAVMMLGVKQGQQVKVTAEGADEEAASAAMQEFLEKNL